VSTTFAAFLTRHERRIEVSFASFGALLVLYAVAEGLHLLPGEPAFQPWRLALVATALLLQPAAMLLRRHRPLCYVLLALSLGLIAVTFVVAG
jgi:hypothetical protein